jgi:integrase
MKCELTARLVAAFELPADKHDETLWDIRQPGFTCRIRRRNGRVTKTWVARRKRHGKQIKVRIGSADEMSIDVARAAAKKLLAQIDLGHDPAAERRAKAAKDQGTMSLRVAEYLEERAREVRPRSLVEMRRYLTGPYFKTLHNVPLHEIDRARVSTCIKAITREGHGATAGEAKVALSTFYSWAMRSGYTDLNPVINSIKLPDRKPRERVLSDLELAAIWKACGDDQYGKIVRLLICLSARRQEIGGIAWSELHDLDGPQPTWTLPASRAKNGRALVLPLSSTALDIIRSVPRLVNRDQLFGVRLVSGFSAWDQGKKALDQRLGDQVAEWRLHDLRRSAATKMADIGIAPHVIEQILNHQSGHKSGVAGIYNKSRYEREVRTALALWDDHVRTLVAGGKRKVVPFHKTA